MPYTGIQRAILKGRLGGIVQTRSMFVGQTQLGIGDTDATLAEGYISAIFSPIWAYLSNAWATESIEVQHLVDGEWVTMEENPYIHAGTTQTDLLPYVTALVFVAKCVGKRLLGRKFIPGIPEAYTVGNVINGLLLTNAATSLAAYVSTYTTVNNGTWGPGIIAKDGTFHTFSSGVMSALLGTMRRRKPGLGI